MKYLVFLFFVALMLVSVSAQISVGTYDIRVAASPGEESIVTIPVSNDDFVPHNVSFTLSVPDGWEASSFTRTISPKSLDEVTLIVTPYGDEFLPEYFMVGKLEYGDFEADVPLIFAFDGEPLTLDASYENQGFWLIKGELENLTDHEISDLEVTLNVPDSWRKSFSKRFLTVNGLEKVSFEVKVYPSGSLDEPLRLTLSNDNYTISRVVEGDVVSSVSTGLFLAGNGTMGFLVLIALAFFAFVVRMGMASMERPSRRLTRHVKRKPKNKAF